jgi:hypothetical protein
MDRLRFVALIHDLGKVFDRKNHQKVIVAIFLDCGITDWRIINYLRKFHQRGNGKDYFYLVKYANHLSAQIQRVNTSDYIIPQEMYYQTSFIWMGSGENSSSFWAFGVGS